MDAGSAELGWTPIVVDPDEVKVVPAITASSLGEHFTQDSPQMCQLILVDKVLDRQVPVLAEERGLLLAQGPTARLSHSPHFRDPLEVNPGPGIGSAPNGDRANTRSRSAKTALKLNRRRARTRGLMGVATNFVCPTRLVYSIYKKTRSVFTFSIIEQ
jgi:hypothetical protein